jgi:hypothetical protein
MEKTLENIRVHLKHFWLAKIGGGLPWRWQNIRLFVREAIR